MRSGEVDTRRQERLRTHLAWPLKLRYWKVNDARIRVFRQRRERDGTVAGAKIDADDMSSGNSHEESEIETKTHKIRERGDYIVVAHFELSSRARQRRAW